jgi:hypothetical protein
MLGKLPLFSFFSNCTNLYQGEILHKFILTLDEAILMENEKVLALVLLIPVLASCRKSSFHVSIFC